MKLSDYLDLMTLYLICSVSFASLFPARGKLLALFHGLSNDAIALLFFIHGVKLPHEAVIVRSAHWRRLLWISGDIFAISPLLERLFVWLRLVPISQEIYNGFLYRNRLSTHVQSSMAFTSLTGGNVAAAVCSASVVGREPLSIFGDSGDEYLVRQTFSF